jgi:MOSC domain-containing protein YiiM
VKILQLYVSDGHNFIGHHGSPAGDNPIREVDSLECVAGRGIKGDRFFDHKADFRGQITFFAAETHHRLEKELGVVDTSVSAFRRNVVTKGVDLNKLIEQEFEVQGVRFFGTEECRPCYWMDQAFAPGAEVALAGFGGLRARILSSGTLHCEGP